MSSRNLPGFLRRSRRYDEEEEEDALEDRPSEQQGISSDVVVGQAPSSDVATSCSQQPASLTISEQSHTVSQDLLPPLNTTLLASLNKSEQSLTVSRDLLPPLSSTTTTSNKQQSTSRANFSRDEGHINTTARHSVPPENLVLSDSWQEIHHENSTSYTSNAKESERPQLSYRELQFEKILVQPDIVNMTELRSLSWNGIPTSYRATAWKILLGYLPTNKQRRKATLQRKRSEYKDAMAQHYDIDDNSRTLQEQETLRQVIVDVPRTCPDVPLFRNERIKRILTRILYIFAMRHPASSYVQGFNDIASPFVSVFLSDYYDGQDVLDGSVMHHLSDERLDELEADVYWCLTNLLANIQDHYTSDQPGVQRMVGRLEELVNRIDAPLCEHLREQGIEFLQFSFKWMNCLLLREFRLQYVPRLWDTYISESNGFDDFHAYVCAAYLCQFSAQLQEMVFDELFGFFQSLQTGDWKETEIEMLLSQAYVLSTLFRGSDAHLNSVNR
jgi:hypothetical protein